MATTEELCLSKGSKFMFRGKIYKFRSYIPVPSIEMIDEVGEIFSFGVDSPVASEFILIA